MPSNDALKSLHTALIDAKKGYDEAAADAEKPEMTTLFQKMSAMHARAHDGVHKILAARGAAPDDAGSFMATVHKTVIGVRSAITGLDHNSLASFASGEERIVKSYDAAIEANAGDTSVAETLRQQRSALLDMISEMQRLAA